MTGRKYAKKDDDEILPAIFDHTVKAYDRMLEQANRHGDAIIYEGFLTHLITQDLALSVPYYSSIRKLLIDMGCVRQLSRGGGTAPSQFEMITEPTRELFLKHQPKKDNKPTKLALANERIDRLEAEVGRQRLELDAINEFLAAEFGAEGKRQ